MSPEAVIKKNAMFLMELNACMEGDSKDTSTATSGWTINLFPQASVVTPTMTSACMQTDVGVASQPVSNFVSNCYKNRCRYLLWDFLTFDIVPLISGGILRWQWNSQ